MASLLVPFSRKPEVQSIIFTYLKSAHHIHDLRFLNFSNRIKIKKVNVWRHFWCHFPRKPEVQSIIFTYLKSAYHIDDFRFLNFLNRIKIKKVYVWRHFWCQFPRKPEVPRKNVQYKKIAPGWMLYIARKNGSKFRMIR